MYLLVLLLEQENLKRSSMWEILKEHAWIVLWIGMTPIIMIIGLLYYITNAFDNIRITLNDWNDIDKDYFE